MEDLVIRPYERGDETAILTTFNQVFREVCGEGYVDRSLDQWRWEFLDNPQGMRVMLALTPDNRVAAQYAATPMAAITPDGTSSFVHAVDSMVHPDFRQGLKKPGLFVTLGRQWFDYIRDLGKESMGFGYPVRPAWRIGNRYLGYSLVRVIDYQVLTLTDYTAPGTAVAGLEVEQATAPPAGEVDALWAEWARGAACAVIRDSAYLDWRYHQCPSVGYRFLLARRQGKLVGLAVIHPSHELVPGALTFADWLVLPGEDGARHALLAQAQGLAEAASRERMLIILPPWSEDGAFFTAAGFATVPSKQYLERRLGSYIWQGSMDAAWLGENWYYTLGDSDLV